MVTGRTAQAVRRKAAPIRIFFTELRARGGMELGYSKEASILPH